MYVGQSAAFAPADGASAFIASGTVGAATAAAAKMPTKMHLHEWLGLTILTPLYM